MIKIQTLKTIKMAIKLMLQTKTKPAVYHKDVNGQEKIILMFTL